MEDKLRNLKKEMDSKVFKDIPFNREESIQSVLAGTRKGRNPRRGFIYLLKKWYPEFIGFAVCTTILFVLVNIGIESYSNSQKEFVKEETIDKKEKDTLYSPTPKKELSKEVTAEEMFRKMMNSKHYFDTAKGEFHLHYDGGGEYPMDLTIQYELSIKQKVGYSREFDDEVNNMNYYNDNKEWRLIEQEKMYLSETIPEHAWMTTEEDKKLFDVHQNGDVTIITNPTVPPIGVAKQSLFPYEMIGNYINNINDISIENQNEELLGHKTIVMIAKIKDRSIKTIRLWVDKDTGILVKYETYNSSGEVVDYLNPTKLEVNVPIDIDTKRFTPNLDGYTDYKQANQENS